MVLTNHIFQGAASLSGWCTITGCAWYGVHDLRVCVIAQTHAIFWAVSYSQAYAQDTASARTLTLVPSIKGLQARQ